MFAEHLWGTWQGLHEARAHHVPDFQRGGHGKSQLLQGKLTLSEVEKDLVGPTHVYSKEA
jgi:hypothetical protein